MSRSALLRSLRDPYVAFCATAIVVWLAAWLVAFHNLYGWLVDDQDTFYRVQTFAKGGLNLIDIKWFHAYMWFLMTPAVLFRWSLPSHLAARAYGDTPQFRALILYTIVLHGVVLALVAAFIRQLCGSRLVSGAAFFLIVTSPTLALFTPFLDSRYLSLLAALPGLMLMVVGSRAGYATVHNRVLYCFLPGFLFGVGEDIHYECLYLVVFFSVVFWGILLVGNRGVRDYWKAFLAFIVGILAWVVPLQLLTMQMHPFESTYIGSLLTQYVAQINPYTRLENIFTWWKAFSSEMGLPLIVAATAGFVVLAFDRLRPSYMRKFDARVIVGSSVLFSLYLLESRTFPFYRMSFCYQFFYALAACVFADQVARRIFSNMLGRVITATVIVLAISIVPTFLRTPEVYAAQQGYGAAVNAAYADAGDGNVQFIDTFNVDGVTSRSVFQSLPKNADVVTYFPVSFHTLYPDLFALLENVRPVAQYRTVWCTTEMWAQVPNYYGMRDWREEPQNCETRVYRVADIRRAEAKPPLEITSIRADSSAGRSFGPNRALAVRNPATNLFGADQWKIYWDLWVSSNAPGKHWIVVQFRIPKSISRVTVIPTEFRVPPDFLWRGRERVSNMTIQVVTPSGRVRTVWQGSQLEREVAINAEFRPIVAASVRFVLWQFPQGKNDRVALKYIDFPEYAVRTSWDNVDAPGKPGPGR